MYVSDLMHSSIPSYWATIGTGYSNSKWANWMAFGGDERPITHNTDNSTNAFQVNYSGSIGNSNVTTLYGVRPTFYLNSSVTYVSGNGTSSSPIVIN